MAMLTPFGKAVRKLRIDRAVMLKDMADRLEVTSAYISAVETGKKNPTTDLVNKVAKYFGLSPSEAREMHELAKQSLTEVRIKTKGASDKSRDLVAAFARSFPTLNPDEMDRIIRILDSTRGKKK